MPTQARQFGRGPVLWRTNSYVCDSGCFTWRNVYFIEEQTESLDRRFEKLVVKNREVDCRISRTTRSGKRAQPLLTIKREKSRDEVSRRRSLGQRSYVRARRGAFNCHYRYKATAIRRSRRDPTGENASGRMAIRPLIEDANEAFFDASFKACLLVAGFRGGNK